MADPVKRVHYFNKQFLREEDFTDEQNYHIHRQRNHNRFLHTSGIAEGLEVPDPPAGSTEITIQTGTAYDDEGREITLANNETRDLAGFEADRSVYITISHGEQETDPTDETGVTKNTRWTEEPNIEASLNPPEPEYLGKKIILAKVNRTGTEVDTVDCTGRRSAGVVGGDLEVNSLTLTKPNVDSDNWPHLSLRNPNEAGVEGSLHVSGNLNIDGTIQGNLADGTVTNAMIAPNAVNAEKIQNLSIGTAELADSAVTNTKIAPNAVNAAKIQDLSIGTNELTDGSVTNIKIAPNAVNAEKIQDLSIGTNELADGAVTNIKIAPNAVNAEKIQDLSIGTNELVDGAVTIAKFETKVANSLNVLSAGPSSDASNLHYHATIPMQSRRYHVPLAPFRHANMAEFTTNPAMMTAAANTKAAGKIPLYIPHDARLTQINIHTTTGAPSFRMNVTLWQVFHGSNSGTILKEITITTPETTETQLDHVIDNDNGGYLLLIRIEQPAETQAIYIDGIFIDYEFNRLF
jgi:hypothetical protein